MYSRTQQRKSSFLAKSKETPVCPYCGKTMKYRDQCIRYERTAGRARQDYKICRYTCKSCKCTLRALPDFLAPYKHYNSDIIMSVIDGEITSDDLEYENYPCEQTMHRWIAWFENSIKFIGEYLLICRARLLAYGLMILYKYVESLGNIRRKNKHWLSIILQIIYNSGAVLEPLREHSG